MAVQESNEKAQFRSGKRLLFATGVLFGLLLGIALTALVMLCAERKGAHIESAAEPQQGKTVTDTVFHYVIQKQKITQVSDDIAEQDTLFIDTLLQDYETQDLTLDESLLPSMEDEEEETGDLVQEKMLNSLSVPVTFLDDMMQVLANEASAHIQVQQWSTPVRNRVTCLFSDNILKVKGLKIDGCKIYHFRGNYYLEVDQCTYLIRPNSHFEKPERAENFIF